jgi:tetratricopeptide (TPR) repeat protein
VRDKGVPAGLQVYEQYRTDFLGSGLYDFRERTLNIVGTRLREDKRLDDAAAIFKANLERFPKSINALLTLGQIAVEKGDRKDAEAWFTRAVEADPASAFARQWLEKLKTSPPPASPPK